MKILFSFFFLVRGVVGECIDTSTDRRAPHLSSEALDQIALEIIHWNDVHARVESFTDLEQDVGGFSRLAGMARKRIEVAADEGAFSLVLDGGDAFAGTAWSAFYKGQEYYDTFNLADVQAFALGNHEFDYGPEMAVRFIENLKAPVLSCNIDYSNEPAFENVQNLHDYHIIQYEIDETGQNLTIGLIGTTSQITHSTSDVGGVVFTDESEAIPKCVDALEADPIWEAGTGIKIMILMSHSGGEVDDALDASVTEPFALILGSHTHYLYANDATLPHKIHAAYPRLKRVESFSATNYIGYTRWKATVHSTSLEMVDPQDAGSHHLTVDLTSCEVDAKIEYLMSDLDDWRYDEIATVETALEGMCQAESNMGNLVTDAYIWKHGSEDKVSVAFKGSSGIQASIPAGQATNNHIIDALPYTNFAVYGYCPVSVLEAALKKSIIMENCTFLQVGGIWVRYSTTQELEEVLYYDEDTDDYVDLLQRTEPILTIMDSYINGNPNLYDFSGCALQTGELETDVVTEFMQHLGTVSYTTENRIYVQNTRPAWWPPKDNTPPPDYDLVEIQGIGMGKCHQSDVSCGPVELYLEDCGTAAKPCPAFTGKRQEVDNQEQTCGSTFQVKLTNDGPEIYVQFVDFKTSGLEENTIQVSHVAWQQLCPFWEQERCAGVSDSPSMSTHCGCVCQEKHGLFEAEVMDQCFGKCTGNCVDCRTLPDSINEKQTGYIQFQYENDLEPNNCQKVLPAMALWSAVF